MTFDIQIANRLSIVRLASLAIVCSLLISCGGGGSTSNPDSNAAPSADPTTPAPGTGTTSPTAGTSTAGTTPTGTTPTGTTPTGTTPTGTTPSTATPTVPTPVPTPDAACLAAAVSWNVGGNTCVANAAASVSGAMAAVNDATGLATGSAAFLCTNGKLAATQAATATCSTPAYDDEKFGLVGFTPCTNVGNTTPLKENDALKLGGVKTDIAFGNGMYKFLFQDTTKDHRFVYLFNQTADLVLSRDKFSRNTLDNYGTGALRQAYCKKSIEGDNAPVFSAALTKLTSHLNGTSVLTAFQIREQHTLMATTMAALAGSEASLGQAFTLIDLYDAKRGALFTLGAKSGRGFENVPVRDKPTSDDAIDNFSIDRAIFALLQAIFEDIYAKPDVYVKYEAFLKGKKFLTSNSFPGAVKNQAISANFKTQINASVPKYFGVTPRFANVDARRPTGYFLQAGDTGSVDVPSSLVNKGYKILVGAHTSDKSAVEHTFRPYLMHMEFPITATKTKIYNPFGGGVYLIVPLGSADGIVTLGINNVVASPFFSNTSHRKTTLAEWEIQRKNPGPTADFESDKFMLQVPTSFIFNYLRPDLLMAEWDNRMDAISSSHGQPLVSGNVKMFKQIDVYRDHDFYGAAGYPMSTDQYETYYDSTRTGNENAWYLRTGPNFLNQDGTATGGKEFWATVDFHEYGHTLHVSMFSEYTEYESIVNFPAVALYAKAVGQDIDTAFGNSHPGLLGGKPPTRILAAVDWMVTQKFRDGKTMLADEMSYQFRGHAKYVDIVALFGWDSIGKFFKKEQDRAVFLKVDRRPQFDDGFSQYFYGANNGEGTDSRIFRLSKAAGVDLRPLLHFWGVQPIDNTKLAAALGAAGLVPSRKIYERIELYRDNILSNTASYKDWQNLPVAWNATFAQQTRDYINNKILSSGNNYFPNGKPATLN
jgi:N-terminal domain of M60-like peptidases